MDFDQQQLVAQHRLWAFVFYSIGVIGLFWVFRRSIMARRRRQSSTDDRQAARQQGIKVVLGSIKDRVHYQQLSTATYIPRARPLSDEHRALLAAVAQWQQTARNRR